MKQEDRSYLDNLMREFTTMDDDLIEQPCCKLIDDYPYHLIERCEEEVKMVESIAERSHSKASQNKNKKSNEKKRRTTRLFSGTTPEKQFARKRNSSRMVSKGRNAIT